MLKQTRKKFIEYSDIFFIDLLPLASFTIMTTPPLKKTAKKYVAYNSEPF